MLDPNALDHSVIIKNAQVYISENNLDTFVLQLIPNPGLDTFFWNYKSKMEYPLSGHTYKIIVKAPGKPTVTATTTIPNVVNIQRVDTSRIILNNVEYLQSNIEIACDISFTDPPNEKNYYLLYVYLRHDSIISVSNGSCGSINFICNDPIVEENINNGSEKFGIAFSDKSINGKQYRLRVILSGNDIGQPFWNNDIPILPTHKATLYFRLYSITEDYFKYIHTLNLFLENYNNPLGIPTQVYSNVTGGYGIFAGAAVSSDSIVFKY
jgi:hypothetical protein